MARTIHEMGSGAEAPFIAVNSAAIPSGLWESEIFGHEKGAFSGATSQRTGRFELADQGTLFLDEIGEIPLDLQAKLLQVLQSGEFERLGSSRTRKADVRVIAATNRNLRGAVDEGRFRDDLYYRLSVFPIEVPPLRQRPQDIRPLVLYFVSRHNARHGRSVAEIPESTMTALETYDWPGNIRELENVVERGLILSQGRALRIDASSLNPRSADEPRAPAPSAGGENRAGAPAASGTLESVERAHILATLESCNWRVKGRGNAADRLGLNEATLRSRMKRLGIQRKKG
jgi:transcriptional regulator with GAF, ATPase, and Fis domain